MLHVLQKNNGKRHGMQCLKHAKDGPDWTAGTPPPPPEGDDGQGDGPRPPRKNSRRSKKGRRVEAEKLKERVAAELSKHTDSSVSHPCKTYQASEGGELWFATRHQPEEPTSWSANVCGLL